MFEIFNHTCLKGQIAYADSRYLLKGQMKHDVMEAKTELVRKTESGYIVFSCEIWNKFIPKLIKIKLIKVILDQKSISFFV